LDAGGMDEVVVFLAMQLRRYGFNTAVLHASAKGNADGNPTGRLGQYLRSTGIRTRELGPAIGAEWVSTWRPDVISAHGAPGWVLDVAARLSIPYVETLHGMHSLFNADWANEAARSHGLARIVAVSDLVRRQYLAGNPGFPPERTITIPNGVDNKRRRIPDRFTARARLGLNDEYLFVSLARHCLQKNTHGLISAFDDLAAHFADVHLLIAGRPDDPIYFGQVQRLHRSIDHQERIHLRDHIMNPGLLLAAADGFVLDSFFEGWSLASMEALCAGVPVVVSDVGGAREQVGDDVSRGYVIPNPAGDPLKVDWKRMREISFRRQPNREALVDAMASLVKDRDFRLTRRTDLSEESLIRFQADSCVRKHVELLAEVVRDSGGIGMLGPEHEGSSAARSAKCN
jgi:glycosyltransferase involved in cell wall biosynthesis